MKRLATMKQLQYLVALADTRHFARAAERCHITQSTLSAGIRDLESVLGAAVAERSNRQVMGCGAFWACTAKCQCPCSETRGAMTGPSEAGQRSNGAWGNTRTSRGWLACPHLPNPDPQFAGLRDKTLAVIHSPPKPTVEARLPNWMI